MEGRGAGDNTGGGGGELIGLTGEGGGVAVGAGLGICE